MSVKTIIAAIFVLLAAIYNVVTTYNVWDSVSKLHDNKDCDQIISEKAKNMIKNIIDIFEKHIDSSDPANNCLDVAIITAPEKRTQKTKDKLKTIAGRVLNK